MSKQELYALDKIKRLVKVMAEQSQPVGNIEFAARYINPLILALSTQPKDRTTQDKSLLCQPINL